MVDQVIHVPTNSDFCVGIKSYFEPQKNTTITVTNSNGETIESKGTKGDYTTFRITTDGKEGEDIYNVTLAYDSYFYDDGTTGMMPLPPQFKGKSFNCLSFYPLQVFSGGTWMNYTTNRMNVVEISRNPNIKYNRDYVCTNMIGKTTNSKITIFEPDPFDYIKYSTQTLTTADKNFTIPNEDGLYMRLFVNQQNSCRIPRRIT